MSERIIYVAFDHLNQNYGALRHANKGSDVVVLVESQRMIVGRNWHPERLFFLISSARHFAQQLTDQGYRVQYVQAPTTVDGLKMVRSQLGEHLPIVAAQPSSFEQQRQLAEFGVHFVPNDLFLTLRTDFESWAAGQKTFVMENFYRAQRVRLGVLMEKGKPIGGLWNFDKENRLPPPKNYEWTPPLEFDRDEIDHEVGEQIGHSPTQTWATTRDQALEALSHFATNNLNGFGPYEDAVSQDSWALHHSMLSPYLNNGLLHASEVIEVAVTAYSRGDAAIQSVEAFVRQVIGWREYINGMYWYLGEDYRNLNRMNANRKLLPLFNDSTKTKMNCVAGTVGEVEKRAWTHHIPRLMILSNLALITGTNPQEFLDWMRENFVDAAEWVMVPNIIGMGVHADGGTLMTKPYAAGGAYLSRMTQYCKGCAYDPKLRIGDNACPFTTLYWDFLDRHRQDFIRNHRMFQQVNGLNRLTDLPQLRERATQVLAGLEAGTI